MRIPFKLLILALLSGLCWAQRPLTVMTHDSFSVSTDVITAFTEETGIEVRFLAAGDAGEVVNRAILSKGRPLADLLYGIDNNLIARAIDQEIFEPYKSPLLSKVDPSYRFDPEGFVTPIDVGFVNFNLDKAYFEASALPLPQDITDLTLAAYRGLTVVENPASSSPGLAFMLATIARFGENRPYSWLDFWAELRDNELLVTDGWTEAYYTAFSLYGGDRPVVLSYASSPAAEVIFASEPLDSAPTSNLLCTKCVYQQIEAVGILAGTDRRQAAERFIDFMLDKRFQEDIPTNMFVYPVSLDAALPAEFRFGALPSKEQVASLDPRAVENHQLRWLDEWTQVVLQGRDPDEIR
ncbi:MAG: thiamine ABC transporter substrate-binding protein [Trueperaceae bacterium]|nr:MAG: thiamine ABC transporter substrate-binding protein [Trueperaceae bacterium]